jgi:hypothetical protein
MVEVNFGDEIIMRFFHEVGDFLSQVGDFCSHLSVCFGKCDHMSCEGDTSLGLVLLNIRKESRKDRNKFFATGIRLLLGFRLEALFPVREGVALPLQGWKRGGGIASWSLR